MNASFYIILVIIAIMIVILPWISLDINIITFINLGLFALLLTSLWVFKNIDEKNLENSNDKIIEKLEEIIEKLDKNQKEIKETPVSIPHNEQLPHIIEEWKIVIQTQMHFNDLLMKIRTATMSVVLSIFGAAGYSMLMIDTSSSNFMGWAFHPSVLIISAGITLSVSMLIIDFKYYYKMLLGAVKRGYEFDNEFKELKKTYGRKYFGMTSIIKNEIGISGSSAHFVLIFYSIPIIVGIIFLYIVLISFSISSE